ncbi:MAG: sodium:solute symporter [Saprospiraceae bacterium]|nr:sodium:solute symporter [Saprospiraceae bacterium]
MSLLDWTILSSTLLFIVLYGIWKTRGSRDINQYLRGNQEAKWWTIGLSVMATQASAITFLSTPGQGYADGMRFVQFYFGLPIAMVILCITFIPIYYKLKVYTAYEFLEGRFDLKTRSLAAFLFLIQRGLGAGITIYAPAIILSTILGWNLNWTNFVIGMLVITYTVSGGTRAVNVTHKYQMLVIFLGMFTAFFLLISYLPEGVSFIDSLKVAGVTGKLQTVDFSFDWNNRYTFWSGITGGLFLMLAYFGTDQSQVQRYLSGRSITESRLGLIFNGLLKIPMQFFILLVGIMVFTFYQFHEAPIFFNSAGYDNVMESSYAPQIEELEAQKRTLESERYQLNTNYLTALESDDNSGLNEIKSAIFNNENAQNEVREKAKAIIKEADPNAETNDRDYVFITFILNHLPKGLVGLLLAVIFSAAMSSTASELNALASTTTVDIYKRSIKQDGSESHYLTSSKLFTLMWGLFAIAFACFGTLFENLIQFVNIVGSVFYGTILGIFLVAFYIKQIKAMAVFWAAIMAEIIVILTYVNSDIGFLWLNPIGCLSVILLGFILQGILPDQKNQKPVQG